MQAMILAAGFGSRLQPYSLQKPKPLFPILNRPLLVATVERLRAAGFTRIIVNCHHLGDQIVAAVAEFPGVIVQLEDEILGTGGGLRRALNRLDDEPLLVSNGDIYHSMDFGDIYRRHLRGGREITMVLHDYPRFNNVLSEGDEVRGFATGSDISGGLAFTGLQVIDPDILCSIKEDGPSCIIDHYRSLLARNRPIHVLKVPDCQWTDMGTPADYLQLHQDLLTGAIECWPQLRCTERNPILIDPDATCGEQVVMQDWACVGRARIGAGARLSRCVVWDDAVIKENAVVGDAIIAPER